MLFNSIDFLVFFVATIVGYMIVPARLRLPFLLAASAFFYGYSDPLCLLLLLAAATVSYGAAILIERAKTKGLKQVWLTLGIILLSGNLIAFKYTSFFNELVRATFGWFGAAYDIPVLQILLPLGISFYTFLMIGYLIDVFRGEKAERDVGVFALFVLFFPKMVAGPIERGRNMFSQFKALQGFDAALVSSGLQLIVWGLFKKVVVADRIAPLVNRIYDAPHQFDGVAMAFATWLYAFQIYFDFSGYTDMAMGTAMVFGIKVMQNFNRPYFAVSIQDFWKRWHISLSSWLNDYVYTPFSRSRWTGLKFYNLMLVGMMLTFVVSGFWHGANLTFVIWGALHGSYVVVSLLLQKPWNKFAKNVGLTKMPTVYRALKVSVTFMLVYFAYIFFRADTLQDAAYIVSHLGTGWDHAASGIGAVVQGRRAEILLIFAGIAIVMAPEIYNKDLSKIGETYDNLPCWVRWGLVYAAVATIVIMGAFYDANQKFIYFKF